MKQSEEDLHKAICDFIKLRHPDVVFNTDMSGIKLPKGLAVKASSLRSDDGFPDITIYESCKYTHYTALFLEVKKETPFKKNGDLKKMIRYKNVNGIKVPYDHLQQQAEMHGKLRARGFKVEFVWSLDMAIVEINEYLK